MHIITIVIVIISLAKFSTASNRMKPLFCRWNFRAPNKKMAIANEWWICGGFSLHTHWHIHFANLLYHLKNVCIMWRWFLHMCARFLWLTWMFGSVIRLLCTHSKNTTYPFRAAHFFFFRSAFFIVFDSMILFYQRLNFYFVLVSPPLFISKANWNARKKTHIHIVLPNGKHKNAVASEPFSMRNDFFFFFKWLCTGFRHKMRIILNDDVQFLCMPLSTVDYIFGTKFNSVNIFKQKQDIADTKWTKGNTQKKETGRKFMFVHAKSACMHNDYKFCFLSSTPLQCRSWVCLNEQVFSIQMSASFYM